MKLTWKVFGGEMPRLEPHLLPDSGAQLARNTKLFGGALEPFNSMSQVTSDHPPDQVYATKGLHLYDQQDTSPTDDLWLWTPNDADFAKVPMANDAFKRIIITEEGEAPRVLGTDELSPFTDGDLSALPVVQLGVNAGGATAPTVTVGGTASGVATEIVVAFAYVDSTGAVGALSTASSPVSVYPGQTLSLSGMPTVGVAGAGALGIVSRNIYVSATDATGVATFRFWKNHPSNSATYGPTVLDMDLLGEAADDPSPLVAPSTLLGIRGHPNGFLVGFDKDTNRLCRSAIYKPYSWPDAYRDPVADRIVGIEILSQSVVVCTSGRTVLFIGQDPENMAKVDLEGLQPCVAKRTIKRVVGGVLYASPDGLVLVSGTSPLSVISSTAFTRKQWQALDPSSMHAGVHDDRYFLAYDNGSERGTLIFEFDGPSIRSIVRTDTYASAFHSNLRRDQLFLTQRVVQPSGAVEYPLMEWEGNTGSMTQLWRSKKVILDTRQMIGAARVLSAPLSGGVTVATLRLYADGALRFTKDVKNDRPFTMKCTQRYKEFYFEIESSQKVTQVDIASTLSDFQQ